MLLRLDKTDIYFTAGAALTVIYIVHDPSGPHVGCLSYTPENTAMDTQFKRLCLPEGLDIQYNTNFIVNSPWGLFRENNNRNNFKKKEKNT